MKKSLNKVTEAIALKVHQKIQEQVSWIEQQENQVTESIIGVSKNGYDLRQNIQALGTGKATLSYLKEHFEAFVGISYDEYCEGVNIEKVLTPEEKLLLAIKELMTKPN